MYRKPLFKLSNFSWPLRKFASRFPWPGNKTSQNTLSLKFLYVPSTKHKFRAYWKIDDFWLDAFDWIGHFTFLWYPLHLKKTFMIIFCPQGGYCWQSTARDEGDNLVWHLPGAFCIKNPRHWSPIEPLVFPLCIPLLPQMLFRVTLIIIILISILLLLIIIRVPINPSLNPAATLVFPTLPKH